MDIAIADPAFLTTFLDPHYDRGDLVALHSRARNYRIAVTDGSATDLVMRLATHDEFAPEAPLTEKVAALDLLVVSGFGTLPLAERVQIAGEYGLPAWQAEVLWTALREDWPILTWIDDLREAAARHGARTV